MGNCGGCECATDSQIPPYEFNTLANVRILMTNVIIRIKIIKGARGK
jgi:hypothetical protein